MSQGDEVLGGTLTLSSTEGIPERDDAEISDQGYQVRIVETPGFENAELDHARAAER